MLKQQPYTQLVSHLYVNAQSFSWKSVLIAYMTRTPQSQTLQNILLVQNDTADAHAISDAPVNSRDGSFPK
jgi:hypothetical protein